jgi:hypothetical protein
MAKKRAKEQIVEIRNTNQLQSCFLCLIKVESATAAEVSEEQISRKPPAQQASREAGQAQQLHSV